MRTLYTLTFCFAVAGLSMVGCTDAQQLEDAQSELAEEQNETAEVVDDAMQDGMVTDEEAEDITEEQGETVEAAGEVAEQQGELIEEGTD
ncbi:MAG: hypothetical protein DWQ34_24385 [Planctomycetota bacterium]|nr:MAG: hypothetical protein DWQ34_24385 [Planctomycetota bacterium]